MELSNEKNSNEGLNIFKYTYFDCEIIERDRVVNYLDENIKYFIDTTNDKKGSINRLFVTNEVRDKFFNDARVSTRFKETKKFSNILNL